MTTEPLRPNLPEEEDSWTDLAEDLFGIDFAQTPQNSEFVSPEELLAEDDETLSDSVESKDPSLSEEIVGAEQSEETEASPLSAIETETTEQETSHSIQDLPEVEGSEDEEPTSERDRSTDKTKKDDTFWDALNDWNWDDGKGHQVGNTDQNLSDPKQSRTKSSSLERQKPVSNRIVREEDVFSSAEDLHEEYSDDSDFGAGLLQDEDEPVSESEVSESEVEQTGQVEETRSKSQQSRRRRRRRPRRTKKDTEDVETVSEGDEKIELKEVSFEEDGNSDQDDAAEATSQKKSSRRRSSRSRKRRSDSPISEHDSQTPESTGESEEFGELILDEEFESDSEESSRESQDLPSKTDEQAKTPHRDVPTWEEAISYLLISPKPSTEGGSERKTSQVSTATKDSSESSQSSGRRRRRRR